MTCYFLALSNLSILAAAREMNSQKWVLHFNAHLVSMATFLQPCFLQTPSILTDGPGEQVSLFIWDKPKTQFKVGLATKKALFSDN